MAESSLTGFILQQAFKSRKEAKAEKTRQDKAAKDGKKSGDKDKKGLFGKAFSKNLFGGLFGGKRASGSSSSTATGALLGGGKKKKKKKSKDKESKGTTSTGKAKGLEKILLTGFGSLVADTTAISGGLAALTEIMNSQMNITGEMSSGIQGINSILSDQLEVQTSFIDMLGLGGVGGGGGGAGGLSNLFGSANGEIQAKGGSLTGFIADAVEKVKQVAGLVGAGGAGAAAASPAGGGMLAAAAPAAAVLGVGAALSAGGEGMFQLGKMGDQQLKDRRKLIEEKKARGENTFFDETLQVGQTGLGEVGKTLGVAADVGGAPVRMLGELIANPFLNEQQKKDQAMNLAKYDTRIREHARGWMNRIDFLNIVSNEKGGFGNIYGNAAATKEMAGKMSAGGTNAMIGEAGKEAIVPLHSADSPAKSKVGMDPSMQASAGSMLAVTDQFIKSMGPLGGSVSQALGADISNLAKTFGMSQTLPNLSLGGGKFREDTSAKKGREKFMKELIAGSLESLGAKKKDSTRPPSSPPSGPGSTGTPEQKQKEEERQSDIMDNISPSGTNVKYKPGKDGQLEAYTETKDDVAFKKIGTGIDPKTNKPRDIMGPSIDFRPVEGTNGTRFYDSDGKLYARENNKFRTLTKTEQEKGWNGKPFMRSTNDGHVRVNPEDWFLGQGNLQRPPANGEYSYKWGKVWRFNPDGKINTPKGKGDWQDVDVPGSYGGNYPLPPTNNIRLQSGGKVVQKPWWDFLGWVTGAQEVKKGTTGIYSDSPMGRISEAAAQRNKMMKELGYQSGGTMTSVKPVAAPPKASPVSYAPMATADTEDVSIGAIVNIVSAGGGGGSIPIPAPEDGPTTADHVSAPVGGGLAFNVLSTNYWG